MTNRILSETEKIVFWLIGATEELHRLAIISEPPDTICPELRDTWKKIDEDRLSMDSSAVAGFGAEHVRRCTNCEQDFLVIYHILMLFFHDRTELFKAYLEDTLENSVPRI